MTTATLLDRLLGLSRFDGDSAAALRAVHAHFAETLPACLTALFVVRGEMPGHARLAGLIGDDGTEHVPNLDAFGDHTPLLRFDDALAARIFTHARAQLLPLSADTAGTPLAATLLGARSILALPIVASGRIDHWLVLASRLPDRFAGIALDALLLETNLIANFIARPITTRALRDQSARQRQEIEGLADVQKLLLPDNLQIRGLDYAIQDSTT